jgi:hypothetical protein
VRNEEICGRGSRRGWKVEAGTLQLVERKIDGKKNTIFLLK